MHDSLIATRRSWSGTVTVDNVDAIAKRIVDMFAGKYYTSVEISKDGDYVSTPRVHTSQRLNHDHHRNGPAIYTYHETEPYLRSGFNVGDTHGSWGVSTSARSDDRGSWARQPWISFEPNQITIVKVVSSGAEVTWIFKLDNREGDDE